MSEIKWERTGGRTWTVTVTTDEPVSPLMAWAERAILGTQNAYGTLGNLAFEGAANACGSEAMQQMRQSGSDAGGSMWNDAGGSGGAPGGLGL